MNSIFSPLPVSTVSDEKGTNCCRCITGYSCCRGWCDKGKGDEDSMTMKQPIVAAEYIFHVNNPQRMVR